MITQERLRELVHYCPETGIFTHLESKGRKKAGTTAGSLRLDEYVYIMISGTRAMAHRFAWLYMTGEWPVADIDHIDGNKSNNSFNNLRDVSRSVNAQNQNRAKRTSKTGYLGVRYHGPNKFVAAISVNGKSIYLGVFGDSLDAHNAYLTAKRKLHEGCVI
jgi:hypothetical protein